MKTDHLKEINNIVSKLGYNYDQDEVKKAIKTIFKIRDLTISIHSQYQEIISIILGCGTESNILLFPIDIIKLRYFLRNPWIKEDDFLMSKNLAYKTISSYACFVAIDTSSFKDKLFKFGGLYSPNCDIFISKGMSYVILNTEYGKESIFNIVKEEMPELEIYKDKQIPLHTKNVLFENLKIAESNLDTPSTKEAEIERMKYTTGYSNEGFPVGTRVRLKKTKSNSPFYGKVLFSENNTISIRWQDNDIRVYDISSPEFLTKVIKIL